MMMKAFRAPMLCAMMMLALVLVTAVAGATTKTGTKGDNVLRGTPHADEFHGQAGDDKLYGGAGGDTIVGGEGRDHIAAGEGHDRVFGNQGRDRIRARDATRDIVDRGKGVDRVMVDPRDEQRSCELRVKP